MSIDGTVKEELVGLLSDPSQVEVHGFDILRTICELAGKDPDDTDLQELILRALELSPYFGNFVPILHSLVRQVGLFPYLTPEQLPLSDQIAYEAHRPFNMEPFIVFHRPQAKVYRLLLQGENVILSAPMSFGKSLIIDAILATDKYNNIVIIVPTIALMDETRRRLSLRLKDKYKIITHTAQQPQEKNIYILTQERFLDNPTITEVDLFIIDEFYKLSPRPDNDERWEILNQAFYRLNKIGRQFYLLGPTVKSISMELKSQLDFKFIYEEYHTVVSELRQVSTKGPDNKILVDLCKTLAEPTIIFCSSPARAGAIAKLLLEHKIGKRVESVSLAADWIARYYHPEWHFVKALSNGIGVHHGRIPRALAQYVVRAFNDGYVNFLVCTSTLIEGVNTKARNMIIFDRKIAKHDIDRFTFNNIIGRAGRMFEHFIGRVFLFDEPPDTELPDIDAPVYSQGPDAPDRLLIQIDQEELTQESIDRLEKYRNLEFLDYNTLKENTGIDIGAQIQLAEYIFKNAGQLHPLLYWTYRPEWEQLLRICELVWEYFGGIMLGARSVKTYKQLAFLITLFMDRPSISEVIETQLEYNKFRVDSTVQSVLDFIRLWAQFHFPKFLTAVNNIQKDVFTRLGIVPGNYEAFANMVENLFMDPAIIALDEYGIPMEIGRKLEPLINPEGDLDFALEKLKQLDSEKIDLEPFEREIIEDVRKYI